MKVNTVALKEALAKCGKCAKNDKAAPLTQLLHINTKDAHTLVFTTTDERNTFSYYLKDTSVEFEEIDVCVLIEQISKLVSKFNSPVVELSVSERGNELCVNGDGDYKISIPEDSDGEHIKYPVIEIGTPVTDVYNGSLSKILGAAKYCEGSLVKQSLDLQIEEYPRLNYFVGDKVIALDGFLVTLVNGEFATFNTLISPTVMKLLSSFSDTDFKFYKDENYIVFECDSCLLVSVEPEGLDIYPLDSANNIPDAISTNCIDNVNVSASVLSNALNRLSLFTDEKHDNQVKLEFNENGVFAYTINGACVEPLSSEPCKPFTCFVNAPRFMSLLKAYSDDILTISFGSDQALRVDADNITQIIVIGHTV